MYELPFNIHRYLHGQWVKKTIFAYVLIDKLDGCVDWSENLTSLYGISLIKGKPADQQLLFLEGIYPYQDFQPLILEAVGFSTERVADIHIVPCKYKLCVLFIDVTESAKLQQELQQQRNEIQLLYDQEVRSMRTLSHSYHELKRQKEGAVNANKAKSDFLQQITHDLKLPLTCILGFAQLLERQNNVLTTETLSYVHEITKSGNNLLTLINSLFDFSKIESGKIRLDLALLNFSDVLADCISTLKPLAKKHQIDFITRIDTKTPMIFVDKIRFRQIIVNLLSNAIKYNRQNGCIIISSYLIKNDTIRINIRDTGIGIKPEYLDSVFQPFERGAAENSIIEGTGIGLTLCKQLVELMQGTMGVESDINLGSLFWLEIPLASEQIVEIKPHPQSRTIVYISDNKVHINLVACFLTQRHDFTLVDAADVSATLQIMNINTVSAILMDTDMGAAHYLEMVKTLQADAISKDIPIIALFNAKTEIKNIKEALNAGVYDYMINPFEFNLAMELFDRLAAVY